MKTNRNLIIVTIITLLAVFSSCQRPVYSPQLVEADSLCEVKPDSAVKVLRFMAKDTAVMDDDNLYYYYLLTLKAADKSFVTHTSDTLARRIVAHYEEGGDERLLPEVYYYAGRVYRDIGDAPQALDYLQKALDLMENDTTNIKLKSVIYSQMGYTAFLCNLYERALYFHSKNYELGKHQKDTVSMVYGLMDIGNCYEMMHKLDSAKIAYNKAWHIALQAGDNELETTIITQIAAFCHTNNDIQEGLKFIRKAIAFDDKYNRSANYCTAGLLYSAANQEDSAYYYFRKNIQIGNIYAKQTAYKWFSDYYNRKHIPDSTVKYANLFKNITDSIFKITSIEAVEKMNSLYNYQIREKQNTQLKAKLEANQRTIFLLLIFLSVIIISIVYVIMYVRQKRTSYKYKLEKYEALLRQYESLPQRERTIKDTKLAKTQIVSRINSILNAPERTEKLTEYEWNTLSEAVNNSYQGFDEKLKDLCKMSLLEYRVCLLLKAGITQVDISYLLIKSESAISSIRRRLYERAFGNVKNAKDWDRFIASL